MANTIITKNSSTASAVPTSGDLVQGELAVNVTDKRLFTENSGGTVVEVGTNPSSLTVAGNTTVGGTLGVTGLATLASSTLTANPTLTSGTANGVTYLNGSKVLTSGSALTFDGTTFGINGGFLQVNIGGTQAIRVGSTDSIVGGTDNDGVIQTNTSKSLRFLSGGSEQMRLTSTGLGIGTSSPSYPLHVSSSGNNTKARFTNGTTTLDLYCGGSAVYTGTANSATSWEYANNNTYIAAFVNSAERMRIDSSGNLGLGVTPSGWTNGWRGFQVNRGAISWSGTGPNEAVQFSGNAFFTGSGSDSNTATYIAADFATNYRQRIGQHQWYTAPSGTAGNAVSFTQAMTLDASGNLGIGATSLPSYARLHVSGTAGDQTGASQQLVINAPTTTSGHGAGIRLNAASGAKEAVGIIGVVNEASGNAGAMTFHVYNGGGDVPEYMRLTSGGSVGIGTSSPTQKLTIEGAMNLRNGSRAGAFEIDSSGNLWMGTATTAGSIIFESGHTTTGLPSTGGGRVRIDSSGNLLVGMTSFAPSTAGLGITYYGTFNSYTATGDYSIFNKTTSTTAKQIDFRSANSSVGDITCTSTTTAYNTSSDYRLKEDIQPMAGALTKVSALKPVTYKWKRDGSSGEGFIAHELQAVVSGAVTGEKDAVDAKGNPVYQGIDTSFLVATLTAAIQEQQAIIESLTARVSALEGN